MNLPMNRLLPFTTKYNRQQNEEHLSLTAKESLESTSSDDDSLGDDTNTRANGDLLAKDDEEGIKVYLGTYGNLSYNNSNIHARRMWSSYKRYLKCPCSHKRYLKTLAMLADGNTSLSEGHGVNKNVEESIKKIVDKAIVERLNSISDQSTIDIADEEMDSAQLQQQTEEDLEARLNNLRRYHRVEPVSRKDSKVDTSTKQLKGVEQPTENDVLFGRGWDKKDHKGNIKFLEEAHKYRSWYSSATATKDEKKNISELLVESVKSQGYRFLEMDLDGLWHEMTEYEVLKVARQALKKKKRSLKRY